LGEIDRVFLEGAVLRLRVLAGHALRAADRRDRLGDAIAGRAARLEGFGGRAALFGGEREEQVLRGDVLVLELLRLVLCGVENLETALGEMTALAAVHLGHLLEL